MVLNEYHDAALISIDTGLSPKVLSLTFRLENQDVRKIDLIGCDIYRITDFAPQNIVYSLTVINNMSSDSNDICNHLKWASSLTDSSTFLNDERMNQIVGKIQSSEFQMILLEPSWGAKLVALFTEINIQ